MIEFNCEQLSPQWWELRRGVPTASEFGRIITPKTGKLSSSADDYVCQLVADTIRLDPTILVEGRNLSPAMRAGIECEPEARRWYEQECGLDVRRIGFCMTDDKRFGCSPDGLVGKDGGLELKCPLPKTQVQYLIAGGLPDEYKAQVHGSLIVTGRKWWDFVSYSPALPPLMVRVTPSKFTEDLRVCLEMFWMKYQEALEQFKDVRPV